MQIFVPYDDLYKIAECLDRKRLIRQISEAKMILDSIDRWDDESYIGWKRMPVTQMYKDNYSWLCFYIQCLEAYKNSNFRDARILSYDAEKFKPNFLTEEFCNHHKSRLYTKDPIFYSKFKSFGKSYENWYIVNGELKKYAI